MSFLSPEHLEIEHEHIYGRHLKETVTNSGFCVSSIHLFLTISLFLKNQKVIIYVLRC